jgi:hypothetical protein
MSLAQENFERARESGRETLRGLLDPTQKPLRARSRRELLNILHDLEQIGAAVRLDLMNREEPRADPF